MHLHFLTAFALLARCTALAANPHDLPDGLYTEITTERGVVVGELFYDKVPMTVANHVGLAEGTLGPAPRKPFYDGLTWCRVVPGMVLQGGDPTNTGSGDAGHLFPDEIVPGLRHEGIGVLQMGNDGPDTNGSQFCVMLSDEHRLNYQHSVFGRVVRGIEVLPKVRQGDTMRVKILRLGDAARAFAADQASFDALVKKAGRYSGPREPGPDAPFDDPDRLLPNEWDRAKNFNYKLVNFERFTGTKLVVRLHAKAPEADTGAWVEKEAARLGVAKRGALAVYLADQGRWFIRVGKDSTNHFLQSGPNGEKSTPAAKVEEAVSELLKAAEKRTEAGIAKTATRLAPGEVVDDARRLKVHVDSVVDAMIFKLEREQGAPRIMVSADATSREVDLEVGQAVVFVLPNGKELAVWNEKPGRFDLPGPFSEVSMGYGERPFRQLDQFEEIRLPSGGTTRGESLSYIRPGAVLDGGAGKPSTYILFIDDYRISLQQTALKPVLRLRVGVEKASEVERLGPKREIDYFLGLLKHADSGMRLQGVSELAEGLILGSTYAEAREGEIVAALKALEADPDEQIRERVSAKLAEAGDAGSILRRLESMAGKQAVDPDAAWSLGRSMRYAMKPSAIAPVYQRAVELASSSRDWERVVGVAFLSGCPEDPMVAPVIRRALGDPSEAVRAAAVKGLEQIHGDDAEAARKQTIAMLGDNTPEVLTAALESSIYVGEDRLLPFGEVEPFLGHADRRVRIAALRALRFAEEPAVERRLIEMSREEDAGIRAEAAEALAGFSSGDALKRFAELLDDPDVMVRIRGIQGLDFGRAPDRARIIGERLLKETDPDVIRVARTALESAD